MELKFNEPILLYSILQVQQNINEGTVRTRRIRDVGQNQSTLIQRLNKKGIYKKNHTIS